MSRLPTCWSLGPRMCSMAGQFTHGRQSSYFVHFLIHSTPKQYYVKRSRLQGHETYQQL